MQFLKKSFISFLFVTSIGVSGPNHVIFSSLHMDDAGNLILPDTFHYDYALKNYKKGYYKTSFNSFMKAAAFGNAKAQKNIGIMHLKSLGTPKDSIKGHAWIKLASQHDANLITLEDSIFKRLNPTQQDNAVKEYVKLKEIYSPDATLQRRQKWTRIQHKNMTGTRTGSTVPHIFSIGNLRDTGSDNFLDKLQSGILLTNDMNQIVHEFEAFVFDYNQGSVTLRDIILHDN
jgi:hypothetical protein